MRIVLPFTLWLAAALRLGAGPTADGDLAAKAWPGHPAESAAPTAAPRVLDLPPTLDLEPGAPALEPVDLPGALKNLLSARNYAWTTTVEITGGPPPFPPARGATERGGFTVVTRARSGTAERVVRRGAEAFAQKGDGAWVSLREFRTEFDGGAGRGFGAGILAGALPPAALAANFAKRIRNFRVEGNALVGQLDGDATGSLLGAAGRRGANSPRFDSVEVRFWLKGDTLSAFAVRALGKITTAGGERELELTVTTELRDIGSTIVEVPPAAREKFK